MSDSNHNTLVICIGNRYRGDDAAGPFVARLLKEEASRDFKVVEESGEGAALMERWRGASSVVIIDAVLSGVAPGTVHFLDAGRQTIPKKFFNYSTHAFGVAEALELARALGELPSSIVVYGIEGKSFEAGGELSEEVERAAREVTSKVLQYIRMGAA